MRPQCAVFVEVTRLSKKRSLTTPPRASPRHRQRNASRDSAISSNRVYSCGGRRKDHRDKAKASSRNRYTTVTGSMRARQQARHGPSLFSSYRHSSASFSSRRNARVITRIISKIGNPSHTGKLTRPKDERPLHVTSLISTQPERCQCVPSRALECVIPGQNLDFLCGPVGHRPLASERFAPSQTQASRGRNNMDPGCYKAGHNVATAR